MKWTIEIVLILGAVWSGLTAFGILQHDRYIVWAVFIACIALLGSRLLRPAAGA